MLGTGLGTLKSLLCSRFHGIWRTKITRMKPMRKKMVALAEMAINNNFLFLWMKWYTNCNFVVYVYLKWHHFRLYKKIWFHTSPSEDTKGLIQLFHICSSNTIGVQPFGAEVVLKPERCTAVLHLYCSQLWFTVHVYICFVKRFHFSQYYECKHLLMWPDYKTVSTSFLQ